MANNRLRALARIQKFLRFYSTNAKACPTGYLPSDTSISRIFLKFINFLRSQLLTHSVTHEATRTFTSW